MPEAPCRSGDRQPSSKRQRTLRVTEPNSQNSNHFSLHLQSFAKQTSRTTECPNGLKARCHQSPNTCWKGAISTEIGLMVRAPPPCTTRRTTEWSIEQHYRHVRCVEPREQARRERRLAPKHEQSETHNETMIEETPQLEDIKNRRRNGMSDS